MPPELITFDPIEPTLEVRDISLREITGRIIPFNQQILVRGRPESFAPGSVSHIQAKDIKLLDHHRKAIGKATAIEERADGAYATFKVSRTQAGDEMLELVNDGVIDSFSPGFFPDVQTREGVHTRVKSMPEVSLVTFPAYAGAKVLSVREKEGAMPPDAGTITPETQELIAEPIDLGPLETRMEEFGTALERLQTSIDAPRPQAQGHNITPLRWFHAQVQANFNRDPSFQERLNEDWSKLQTRMVSGEVPLPEGLQTRALDDVTGTFPGATPIVDASGLVVEQYIASQLVNVLDRRRPLFASLGSFPMPQSGYAQIPVVTQHTEVGARAGQKQAANSRSLIVQKRSFEAEWFDGAVDIALELIRSAELPVLAMVWDDLLGQYAIATEAGAVAAVNAAGTGFTYEGTALDLTSYATFAADVATQALVVETNSGSPATKLAVTTAQWVSLVSMVDAGGRRIFAPIGQENADGSVSFTARSFTLVGGIEVFVVPNLTAAMLYNEESLRGSDGGPERVEALNVELMGHDLGILGRTMFVPRIPAGVVVFGAEPSA